MKIKISYTNNEIQQANDIELVLQRIFDAGNNIKIRKPKNSEIYNHTYIAIEKIIK